jgi:hypothetical protein
MRRLILALPVMSLLALASARAEPDEDLTRQAAMAERFEPFDKAGGPDWEAAFPFPFFRSAGVGDVDAVFLTLKPGAYTVVVLCNCSKLTIALHPPDGSTTPPARTNDEGAMYTLDVASAGQYVVSTKMDDCQAEPCSYAVKAYRKK